MVESGAPGSEGTNKPPRHVRMLAGFSGAAVAAVAVFALVFVAPASHRAFSVLGGLEAHDCPGGPEVATIPSTDVVVLAGLRYDGRFGHWSAVTWDDSRSVSPQTRLLWVTDDALERALGTPPSREGGKVLTDPAFDTCTPTPPTVLGTSETRVTDTQARAAVVTDALETTVAATVDTTSVSTSNSKKVVATTTKTKTTATAATTASTTSPTTTSKPIITTTTSTTTTVPKLTMPDVLNLPYQAAQQQLTDLGLDVTLLPAFLPKGDSRDGLVVSQLPTAGSVVDPGSKVSIAVGQVPKVDVPDVVGMYWEDATGILQDAGFEVHLAYDPQSSTDGTVLTQNPPAGAHVPAGSTVTITLNDDPGCCSP